MFSKLLVAVGVVAINAKTFVFNGDKCNTNMNNAQK